jgi:hypothetical protein
MYGTNNMKLKLICAKVTVAKETEMHHIPVLAAIRKKALLYSNEARMHRQCRRKPNKIK